MKIIWFLILSLIIFVCLLNNCGYVTTSVVPSYIKKIYIPTFENVTSEFGIENLLSMEINNLILEEDFEVVKKEEIADAIILGKITLFVKQPFSYQDSRVETYKIYIRASIKFKDLIKDKILWQEDEIREDIFYYPLRKNSYPPETEGEVIEKLIKNLSKEIVNKLIRGW